MDQFFDISSYVLLDANHDSDQFNASIVGDAWNVYDPNICSIRLLLIAIHVAKRHALLILRLYAANFIFQGLSIAVPIRINMYYRERMTRKKR